MQEDTRGTIQADLPHQIWVSPDMVSGLSGKGAVNRGTRDLARDMGVSLSTVVRCKRKLAAAGFIRVTSYPNEEGRPDEIDILPVA